MRLSPIGSGKSFSRLAQQVHIKSLDDDRITFWLINYARLVIRTGRELRKSQPEIKFLAINGRSGSFAAPGA